MEQDKRKTKTGPLPPWGRWVWLLLLAVFLVYLFSTVRDAGIRDISYTEFKEAVRQGNVREITVRGQHIDGLLRRAEEGQESSSRPFATTMPGFEDPGLMELLESQRVKVRAESAEGNWWLQTLIFMLPWLLLIGLIVYSGRKMQQRMLGGGGQGGLFSFGQSRAKRFRRGSTHVTFDDVAGLENAKADLREIVDYLKNPLRYRKLGAKIPKGVLLMGAPGTGKTLVAKAVAGEADVPFYSISGSEFIEMFVGVGAARVRDMFESAKKEAPAIIFIDEIDSVGRARGTGLGGGHDEREQTLNQILSMMDGFSPHEKVVILAATNRPDVLDPALLRPGRFDRKVVLELPQKNARKQILQVHTRHVPLAKDVDLDHLAARTVGFSGADLENLINEAALFAGREKKEEVDMAALEQAKDKIVLGAEREDVVNEQEKKVIAYHESGHAMMAWLLPHADPLGKVTIIPRGRALGATEQTPEEERYTLKRSYLLDRIAVFLGGRTSEKIVFGEVSSGAENDLREATRLARRMVCQWGMSEKLGPVTFRSGDEHVFLGRELAQPRDFSEHTARLIDEEMRRLLVDLEKKVERMIGEHRERLDALASALLERETLHSPEIRELLQNP